MHTDENDDQEKELFSSIKDLPGGANDNKGMAMIASVAVAIICVATGAAIGLKGIFSLLCQLFSVGLFIK